MTHGTFFSFGSKTEKQMGKIVCRTWTISFADKCEALLQRGPIHQGLSSSKKSYFGRKNLPQDPHIIYKLASQSNGHNIMLNERYIRVPSLKQYQKISESLPTGDYVLPLFSQHVLSSITVWVLRCHIPLFTFINVAGLCLNETHRNVTATFSIEAKTI